MDYYQRLGVGRGATRIEIQRAYRELARRFHPDAPGGDDRRMAQLNEAWQVLSDEGRRRDYDRRLRADEAPRTPPPRPGPAPPRDTPLEEPDEWIGPPDVDSIVLRRWLRLMVTTAVLAVLVVSAMFIYAFTRSVG